MTKLQTSENGYATKYGISAATITTLSEGRQWVEWIFNNLYNLRLKSTSLTNFQDELMNGKGETGTLSVPEALVYTAVPENAGTPIPPFADVIGTAAAVGKKIKVDPAYTVADGEDLGLEGAEEPPLPPAESTMPDLSKTRMASAGQVEVVWKKRGFQGVRIEVDRGDGQGWRFLAVDTEPNYVDTAAPPSGTAAIYKYRAIYLMDDQPYGQWSNVAEVAVRG